MKSPTVTRSSCCASGLVLELSHAAGLAVAGEAAEHPRQLGVLGHVALDEEDAALGVDTSRQELCSRDARPTTQLVRVVRHGDRVLVDDAVDALVVVLHAPPTG